MKYLSIDVETTGLNPNKHQILQIGIVLEDTSKNIPIEKLPKLNLIILHGTIVGDPYALVMNKDIIEQIKLFNSNKFKDNLIEYQKTTGIEFVYSKQVTERIRQFLINNNYEIYNNYGLIKLNVAGKNFGTFDKLFIEKLPKFKDYFIINQRIIDPSIYYVDWNIDESLPNLQTCLDRANIKRTVTHDALDDALDVVLLLRNIYNKK